MKGTALALAILLSTSQLNAAKNCQHDVNHFKCLQYVRNYDANNIIFNIPNIHPILGAEIKVSMNDLRIPKKKARNKCARQKAQDAKVLVRNYIKRGKFIELRNAKRNRSFSLKGDLYIDGKNIGELLLKRRLASKKKEYKKMDWCK
jgi:micrococcal nuclease